MTKRRSVGTCDLLAFFTDPTRFPELDVHGVAFISALLRFINTTGSGGAKFQAHPSLATLASVARISKPTIRRCCSYFEHSGWLIVTKRRAGKHNAANLYDVTPAATWIAERRSGPKLRVVEGGSPC